MINKTHIIIFLVAVLSGRLGYVAGAKSSKETYDANMLLVEKANQQSIEQIIDRISSESVYEFLKGLRNSCRVYFRFSLRRKSDGKIETYRCEFIEEIKV